ncbi:MAG: type I-E CRISPR-associated endoribonuclease Cas2 [Deltaproteobacteria bacterium]|nr:type I-E CRISPR-associated endoribonuclease Cas2 [Deltaproteobacteria bacterium]
MVVMILENVPESLRGELSRWMIEPRAGVFVGTMNAMIRDRLWERVNKRKGVGGCMQVYSWPNEQGFIVRQEGVSSRDIADFDGLQLVRRRKTL